MTIARRRRQQRIKKIIEDFMRIPRIYQKTDLNPRDIITLNPDATRHIGSVLRLNKDDKIILFNGDGHEYLAHILEIKRSAILVKIESSQAVSVESPLKIQLGQSISKGERMDFVIQKATELGVAEIIPLYSDRTVVHLKGERQDSKILHWQKIAIASAEQCGRNTLPIIHPPQKLKEWVHACKTKTKFILNVVGASKIKDTAIGTEVALLAGPEGGFSEEELDYAKTRHFESIRLGPRILRTETAAIVAISIIQSLAGDI